MTETMTPSGVEQIPGKSGSCTIKAVTETMTPSGVEQTTSRVSPWRIRKVTETMTPSGVEQPMPAAAVGTFWCDRDDDALGR